MNYDLIIKEVRLVNEGEIREADVAIRNGRFEKIAPSIGANSRREIAGNGHHLLPGIIDDQVHFREPGYTHKAHIASESKAAVAGGVTSFMEMPNTTPPAISRERLEEKYAIAKRVSPANYSFFMGASNDNLEEVLRCDRQRICGVKVFMGSSTGNMLVDDAQTLEMIFSSVDMLIATHCEDEATIRKNLQAAREQYGEEVPVNLHPQIRSVEGCYASSSKAVELARKHNARLHVLHISTAEELALFGNEKVLSEKRITSEVCVHHLYFDAEDYEELGNKIKCNPAIKEKRHREALFPALLDNRLDIIATDHAPHTPEEKSAPYLQAPSGLPLVQHGIHIMLDFYAQGKIDLPQIVDKMSHAPAVCFGLMKRGYIREGYYADAFLLDPNANTKIDSGQILYKCDWSPLQGRTMPGKILKTLVNGRVVWDGKVVLPLPAGMRLEF